MLHGISCARFTDSATSALFITNNSTLILKMQTNLTRSRLTTTRVSAADDERLDHMLSEKI